MDSIDVDNVLERTYALQEMGRGEYAIEILGSALTHDPHNADLLSRMAVLLYHVQGDLPRAHAAASAAIAADPEQVDAFLILALIHTGAGRSDEAIDAARNAVRLAPAEIAPHIALAASLASRTSRARCIEAREEIEHAISLAPHDVDVYVVAATLEFYMRDSRAATRYVDAGLALDATNADLLTMHAQGQGLPGATIDVLRGVLAQQPSHTAARQALANVMWNAISRLTSGIWMFAFAVVLLSMWIPPVVLGRIKLLLFLPIIFMWRGVFRGLRRSLPAGYLRRRLLARPEALVALVFAVLAGLLAGVAPALLTTAHSSSATRGAYIMLLIACGLAALAHLLVQLGRSRPVRKETVAGRGETSVPDQAEALDMRALVVIVSAVVPLLLLWSLSRWAQQPGALWVAIALTALIAAVLTGEALIISMFYSWEALPYRMTGAIMLISAAIVLWFAGPMIGAYDFAFVPGGPPPFPQIEPFPKIEPIQMPTFHITTPTPIPPPSS